MSEKTHTIQLTPGQLRIVMRAINLYTRKVVESNTQAEDLGVVYRDTNPGRKYLNDIFQTEGAILDQVKGDE
jgi:hypothetical protein